MQKTILHIDFDSFFASVEQQVNPLLRNRPIGVTATNGRTCIIAASREAKTLGIKSPSRTFEAQRRCPSIIFVPAHFTLYWEISKKFINICKDFSPFVEIFSLDEVFMDVTRTASLFGGTSGLIEKLKNRIKIEIGEYITVSFGVSHNKLLAKLASGMDKPNGLVTINPEDVATIYQKAKMSDICGIGHRIEARLNDMGIYTLLKLSQTPLSVLIAEFGQADGNFLYQVGQGIDTRKIIPYTEAPEVKSAGRSYCLPQNEYDQRKILQNVYELCEEVALKLRRLDRKAKGIGISLRGEKDFFGRKTFSHYMDSGRDLFEACMTVMNQESIRQTQDKSRIRNHGSLPLIHNSSFIIPTYVRQISIWSFHLEKSSNTPLPLFLNEQRAQKIVSIIDRINERFGDHTLRNGFLLYANKLTTVPNGYMADRFEREKLAKEAQFNL